MNKKYIKRLLAEILPEDAKVVILKDYISDLGEIDENRFSINYELDDRCFNIYLETLETDEEYEERIKKDSITNSKIKEIAKEYYIKTLKNALSQEEILKFFGDYINENKAISN